MREMIDDAERDWTENTALAAPALLGAAAGLILGEVMHSGARRGIAIGLAALGVAALVPLTVGGIVKKVNSPETKRGSRRRLESIRSADHGFVDDDLLESGVV
ncbi:MAG: hypothetical protein AAGI48_09315 [Verrucomicrobiota bacterium]